MNHVDFIKDQTVFSFPDLDIDLFEHNIDSCFGESCLFSFWLLKYYVVH